MSRRGLCAWLAIVALLIDTIRPAVAAVASSGGRLVTLPMCSSGVGIPPPENPPPSLPLRHCALCTCPIVGAAPPRPAALSAPSPIGIVPLSVILAARPPRLKADYTAARPRAPPPAFRAALFAFA